MPKKSHTGMLTDVELEMMNILWQLGSGTVRQVLAQLTAERKLAYTSASTIIRILEQKGFVRSSKSGKSHVYRPTLKKNEYSGRTLSHIIDNIYGGISVDLVRQLVSDKDLTKEEKEEIKRIIAEEL